MVLPDYVTIENEARGEILIKADSQYNNINADTVIVFENISVRLFGTIHKKLTVQKGAIVYLHGSVKGKIDNQGGELFIYNN